MTTRCSDSEIIALWLQYQASPHTQSCYRRDSARLLAHVGKSLTRVTLGDLHGFAQSLIVAGLSPISRARTVAATKSLSASAIGCGTYHLTPLQKWLYRATKCGWWSAS